MFSDVPVGLTSFRLKITTPHADSHSGLLVPQYGRLFTNGPALYVKKMLIRQLFIFSGFILLETRIRISYSILFNPGGCQ